MLKDSHTQDLYKYDFPVLLGTLNHPEYVVIWLHGLGADGDDFVPVVRELKKELKLKNLNSRINAKFDAIKFIFPHAPYRKITMNRGAVMRGWYDINSLSTSHREDEAGVRESVRYIHELIEAEHKSGVSYEKIILAGFSQGGAIALYAGLTLQIKLAGIIALSTYLPISSLFQKECTIVSQKTPILMVHGTEDSVISLGIAEHSLGLLKEADYVVDFVQYPMDHTVCMEEVAKIADFLAQIIEST